MKNSRHSIVICGASIYMLAIEFGLAKMTRGDVVRINPDLPNSVERISELDPDVVIVELNRKTNNLALEILCQSIPLIVMDEARRSIMVLVREHLPKAEISELTQVLEKINHQQDALNCQ